MVYVHPTANVSVMRYIIMTYRTSTHALKHVRRCVLDMGVVNVLVHVHVIKDSFHTTSTAVKRALWDFLHRRLETVCAPRVQVEPFKMNLENRIVSHAHRESILFQMRPPVYHVLLIISPANEDPCVNVAKYTLLLPSLVTPALYPIVNPELIKIHHNVSLALLEDIRVK